MNRQEFLSDLENTFGECIAIARKKNADYAGEGDPFANFRATEVVGVSLERGILVRMMDKMKRVSNLLDRPPAVADESISDTLSDIINYAGILKARLRTKEEPEPIFAKQAREASSL